jgi:apolipoprotein N-acyltransferase
MHTPGTEPVAVPFAGTTVGLNICFDSCYPSIIRDTVNQGAEVIALPTIDPDAPYGWFAANHAAFTPIRAAEEGVSIIRADGYAFSTIADPDGRILAQLPNKADITTTAAVPTRGHWTFYRWAGDWFLYACGAALIGFVWTGLRRRWLSRRQAGQPSQD